MAHLKYGSFKKVIMAHLKNDPFKKVSMAHLNYAHLRRLLWLI